MAQPLSPPSSYKPHITPPLFAALAALQYRNPKLNAALITLWQVGWQVLRGASEG